MGTNPCLKVIYEFIQMYVTSFTFHMSISRTSTSKPTWQEYVHVLTLHNRESEGIP